MLEFADCRSRVLAETEREERVLDVGGGYCPLNTATHVLDMLAYDELRRPFLPDAPVRFSRRTWIELDLCDRPWPFADKYFGYSFCSHTLEDVRDPIGVCRELMRVSRAGYIEVPSRMREIFCPKPAFWLRRALARPARVGYDHHRWFCEIDGNGITFLAKTLTVIASRKFFLTASELGRQLTPDESVAFLFWRDAFEVKERLLIQPGETEAELARFKRVCLARAKKRKLG